MTSLASRVSPTDTVMSCRYLRFLVWRIFDLVFMFPLPLAPFFFFFFFNDPAPPEIYPFPLHDALPICSLDVEIGALSLQDRGSASRRRGREPGKWERAKEATFPPVMRKGEQPPAALHNVVLRSEEHTSELQSPCNLVCRLLLEKKKKIL